MDRASLSELAPLLLPAPVRLARGEGFVEAPDDARPVVVVDEASVRGGGYRLSVDGAHGAGVVRIVVGRESDLHAALATLAQLRRQYGGRLPRVEIEDAPAFATRGVMLDVSRNKVPTMASLEGWVDLLASLKFNHVQLYTEHTFAYAGHEEAWEGCSPVTPAEARRLDEYAAERGVDLAPNQNCFGHLAHWLRLPKYRHLAETHGEWMFMQWPRSGPFSLCPVDPASEALVADLLGQLLPCFSSGLVNIGCDETFDVGFGRSREEVERRGGGDAGRAAVYFEFVGKVCAIAAGLGKRPMLWADIALSQPGALGMWPRLGGQGGVGDPIGLAWGYEPDAKFGQWCRTLREHGIEAWVCPGTSSWRSIVGRRAERDANLAAAAAARSEGATGLLVTDWGDCGHHQHWPISAAAIARAAQAAWNPAVEADARAIALHVFGDETLAAAAWIDELGDIDEPIRRANRIRNASALWTDLYRPETAAPVVADVDAWHGVAERLESLAGRMPGGVDELVAEELAHTVATARLAVDHAIAVRVHEGGELPRGVREGLAEATRRVMEEHVRLWGRRNREGGLKESCGHFERLLRRFAGE